MATPSTKLTYFPLKALAEPIRWLLKYGDMDFEDIRIDFEKWSEFKLTTPFGQLPFYEEDGKISNQSIAISRYLAKKVNLVGNNTWEDLEIDAIADTVNDLKLKLMAYSYEKEPGVKETRKGPLFNEILPFYLDRLDSIAKQNDGYLALGKLTWADFYFVGILDYLNHMAEMDITENHPNLRAVKDHVHAVPAVAAWIQIRPESYM